MVVFHRFLYVYQRVDWAISQLRIARAFASQSALLCCVAPGSSLAAIEAMAGTGGWIKDQNLCQMLDGHVTWAKLHVLSYVMAF